MFLFLKGDADMSSPSLENHGAEGVRMLMRRPRLGASGVIYILLALLAALLAWAFYGRADVIVTVEGRLEPVSEMRRIYVPASGKLMGVYVKEGDRVEGGAVLARVKSEAAVRAASESEQARLRLERVEMDRRLFPQKRALMQKEVDNLWQQIGTAQAEYDRLRQERFRNLPATQRHKLEKLRLQLAEARKTEAQAKTELQKYERLYAMEGHGGISEKEMDERRRAHEKSLSRLDELRIDLDNLEYEFTREEGQVGQKLGQTRITLLQMKFQRDSKIMQMEEEEKQLQMQWRSAKAAMDAASSLTFDDFDEDGLLLMTAPVSGVVTYMSATQPGAAVEADAPLFAIAPAEIEKALFIRVPESERGLLAVGQAVRVKFNAFPYQRYGIIEGVLEYLSPSALRDEDGMFYYEGRVGLARDGFKHDGEWTPLAYGMGGTAEIAVEKRRIIDMVIDPFRKLKQRV